jgi:DNA-directed RNA polymerase beta subunit
MQCFPVYIIISAQLTLRKKNVFQHCVYIASDGGRVCRPLVIADKGISRIKEHHMKELMVSLISASCPK